MLTLAAGLAEIVQAPERFPTIVAPERYTGNRTNVDRYTDGPDAVPVGTPHMRKPGAQVSFAPDDVAADLRAMDVYKARNTQVFDDWQRDMIEDMRDAEMAHVDGIDWDCHGCKRAVVTPVGATRCPVCGAGS